MIQVPKDQFYAMIGQLERIDTGATMHHFPEHKIRWSVRQWIDGKYVEVAVAEQILSERFPQPTIYSVNQRLIDEFITF